MFRDDDRDVIDEACLMKLQSESRAALELEDEFTGWSPAELLNYWVTAEHLARWWAPEADIELRAGGRYHLSWPSMGWDFRGTIEDFEPGRRLAFTWAWDHEPDKPTRRVDVVVAASGDGTRMRICHGPYADTESDQADRQSHLEGWLHFCGQLQKIEKPARI